MRPSFTRRERNPHARPFVAWEVCNITPMPPRGFLFTTSARRPRSDRGVEVQTSRADPTKLSCHACHRVDCAHVKFVATYIARFGSAAGAHKYFTNVTEWLQKEQDARDAADLPFVHDET